MLSFSPRYPKADTTVANEFLRHEFLQRVMREQYGKRADYSWHDFVEENARDSDRFLDSLEYEAKRGLMQARFQEALDMRLVQHLMDRLDRHRQVIQQHSRDLQRYSRGTGGPYRTLLTEERLLPSRLREHLDAVQRGDRPQVFQAPRRIPDRDCSLQLFELKMAQAEKEAAVHASKIYKRTVEATERLKPTCLPVSYDERIEAIEANAVPAHNLFDDLNEEDFNQLFRH